MKSAHTPTPNTFTASQANRNLGNTMYRECFCEGCKYSECEKFSYSHTDENGIYHYIRKSV